MKFKKYTFLTCALALIMGNAQGMELSEQINRTMPKSIQSKAAKLLVNNPILGTVEIKGSDNKKITIPAYQAIRSPYLLGQYQLNQGPITFVENSGNPNIDFSSTNLKQILELEQTDLNTQEIPYQNIKKIVHTADYLSINNNNDAFAHKFALYCEKKLNEKKDNDHKTKQIIAYYKQNVKKLLRSPHFKLTDPSRYVPSCGVLNLEKCNLKTFDDIDVIANYIDPLSVKMIYLNDNDITTLDRSVIKNLLSTFPNLRCLDLSDNKITTLSTNTFVDLPNGFKLLLCDNDIHTIEPQCFACFENGFIDLKNNSGITQKTIEQLNNDLKPGIIQNSWGRIRQQLLPTLTIATNYGLSTSIQPFCTSIVGCIINNAIPNNIKTFLAPLDDQTFFKSMIPMLVASLSTKPFTDLLEQNIINVSTWSNKLFRELISQLHLTYKISQMDRTKIAHQKFLKDAPIITQLLTSKELQEGVTHFIDAKKQYDEKWLYEFLMNKSESFEKAEAAELNVLDIASKQYSPEEKDNFLSNFDKYAKLTLEINTLSQSERMKQLEDIENKVQQNPTTYTFLDTISQSIGRSLANSISAITTGYCASLLRNYTKKTSPHYHTAYKPTKLFTK